MYKTHAHHDSVQSIISLGLTQISKKGTQSPNLPRADSTTAPSAGTSLNRAEWPFPPSKVLNKSAQTKFLKCHNP